MSEIEAVVSAPVRVAPVVAPYVSAPDRYASMPYRRLGRSWLAVSATSLGMPELAPAGPCATVA